MWKKSEFYKPESKKFFNALSSSTASGARQRGLIYALCPEDIMFLYMHQNGRCALTGEKMVLKRGVSGNMEVAKVSVDRIDQTANYTIENVQLVCQIANIARNVLTIEQFENLCLVVARYVLERRYKDELAQT